MSRNRLAGGNRRCEVVRAQGGVGEDGCAAAGDSVVARASAVAIDTQRPAGRHSAGATHRAGFGSIADDSAPRANTADTANHAFRPTGASGRPG